MISASDRHRALELITEAHQACLQLGLTLRTVVSADAISPQITELRSPLNTESHCPELLSSLVSSGMNQAATWSGCVASIPFLKFTPVITLAK